MEQYGTVERLFLQREHETHRKKRQNRGGSKKPRFVEGWVEFKRYKASAAKRALIHSKKVAKRVAEGLNCQPVGGSSRINKEELWNIKYLRGLKWGDLTAEIGTLSK